MPHSLRAMFERLLPPVWAACALIPFLLVILLVARQGQNLLQADEWDLVPVAVKADDGTLTFADLTAQRNMHRMFTARLMIAALTVTTDLNTHTGMFVTVGVALGTLTLLLTTFRRDRPDLFVIALLPFGALVFSLRQTGSWLWAMEINRHSVVIFTVLALWILKRWSPGWKPLVAAFPCALMASFSFLSGNVAWVVIFAALWFFGYRRWQHYVLWMVLSVLGVGLYLHGFTLSNMERYEVSTDISVMAVYFFAFLGNTLVAGSIPAAILVGIAGLGLFGVNGLYVRYVQGNWTQVSFWIALGLFTLATGAMVSFGRGEEYFRPLNSRYIVTTTPLWIGILALMFTTNAVIRQQTTRRWWESGLRLLNMIAFAVIVGLYCVLNVYAVRLPSSIPPNTEACLLAYPATRDDPCIVASFPGSSPEKMRPLIEALQAHRLNVFAAP